MHRYAPVTVRYPPNSLFKLQQSLRMPLNASSLECESKEFAFTGLNDVAFGCINDQFQTVTQESADTT
jgi:hypothetical protein